MSRSTFLKRAGTETNSTPSHHRAPKQEKEWAKRGGGRLTPGSGNKGIKGDVRGYRGMLRLECKTTRNNSFSVTREMIKKLEDSALAHGEVPAIVIEFIGDDGKPQHELAVVPTYVLDMMGEE